MGAETALASPSAPYATSGAQSRSDKSDNNAVGVLSTDSYAPSNLDNHPLSCACQRVFMIYHLLGTPRLERKQSLVNELSKMKVFKWILYQRVGFAGYILSSRKKCAEWLLLWK